MSGGEFSNGIVLCRDEDNLPNGGNSIALQSEFRSVPRSARQYGGR